MKDISIIIVNYNVRYFLEQCLLSIRKAIQWLDIEIILVDNASIDDSVQYIRQHFDDVILIANKVNHGFAKANNQALKIAQGKYLLLLNPDTIINDDTLIKSFDYMEKNNDCGALGVKLIDGKGKFLPESKRAFPTPIVSFFRLIGLSRIFPKSAIFNKYNLGNLDENSIHDIEVLCGAFMFIRSSVFEKTGYLDEDFFMYGEDIDYSYRIKKQGFKIIYFPETTTIHFKGESTKKSSLKYHSVFYNAMRIFAKKHFKSNGLNINLILINVAIIFFALTSLIKKSLSKLLAPLIDFFTIIFSFYFVQSFWSHQHFNNDSYYNTRFTLIFYCIFSIIIVLGIYLNSGYKKSEFVRTLKGFVAGSLTILIIYSILPEHYRYSRAILILGSTVGFFAINLIRLLAGKLFQKSIFNISKKKKIAIIGSENECNRTLRLLKISNIDFDYIGRIKAEDDESENYLGRFSEIVPIINMYKIDELIFCLKDIPISAVTAALNKIGEKSKIKIFPAEGQTILGSSDRNANGEFYSFDITLNLNNRNKLKLKYIFDIIFALIILVFYPILKIFKVDIKSNNIIQVIKGDSTWIGYLKNDKNSDQLPALKPSIYFPVKFDNKINLSDDEIHNINLEYAKNYNIWLDLSVILRNILNK